MHRFTRSNVSRVRCHGPDTAAYIPELEWSGVEHRQQSPLREGGRVVVVYLCGLGTASQPTE